VEGHEILDPNAFRYRIATRGIDASTELSVVSRGEARTVKVTLIAPPEDPPRDERVLDGPSPLTGAHVANLSPAVADELSLDTVSTGVVVVSVESNTIAQRVGFRVGDTIHEINGESIDTADELDAFVEVRRRAWKVTIIREGRMITSVLGE